MKRTLSEIQVAYAGVISGLKDYQRKAIEEHYEMKFKTFIKKLKEEIRKQMRDIPPKLNKTEAMLQADMIMWQEIDSLAGDEFSKDNQGLLANHSPKRTETSVNPEDKSEDNKAYTGSDLSHPIRAEISGTCLDCGHDYKFHPEEQGCFYPEYGFVDFSKCKCKCKKFKEEDLNEEIKHLQTKYAMDEAMKDFEINEQDICECNRLRVNHPSESCKTFKMKPKTYPKGQMTSKEIYEKYSKGESR